MQQGFINTLKNSTKATYTFDTYNANGNRMLMRSQIEEIIQSNYDLIFTIGAQATQLTKEVTIKKQKLTPIVFAAVSDPVKLNIVSSITSSGNHITGTIEPTNYPLQLTLLTHLNPTIKQILLVYNPSEGAGLEKDKIEIEHILKQRGITLKTIEIYSTNEVYPKTNAFINQADAVLILKDNTVVRALDSLVKLCSRCHIPLMATDLDSAEKGAGLGFGVYECDFGIVGATLAKEVLEEGKKPAQIPCQPLKNFKLKVNMSQLQKQNIQLSPEQRFLLTSSESTQGGSQ